MIFEILDQPLRFALVGLRGVVENNRYSEVGLRLMNAMWHAVHAAKVPTTGINHWVYLPSNTMFVGVELRDPQQAVLVNELEPLEIELTRYLRHLHVGPYQELPQKWNALRAALEARGEAICMPSLEVYGHHCENATELETTILIGLKA